MSSLFPPPLHHHFEALSEMGPTGRCCAVAVSVAIRCRGRRTPTKDDQSTRQPQKSSYIRLSRVVQPEGFDNPAIMKYLSINRDNKVAVPLCWKSIGAYSLPTPHSTSIHNPLFLPQISHGHLVILSFSSSASSLRFWIHKLLTASLPKRPLRSLLATLSPLLIMGALQDAFPPILDEGDGIRLLELQRELPTQPGDIRGTLKYVRLRDNPDYVAISYTWGSARPTKSITLADHVHIHISESLFEGLVEVSKDSTRKYLWVDQICINQKDENEKASQVKAMSKIYTQAREVVAWLGPTAKNTELAFRHLRLLGLDDSQGLCVTRDVEVAVRQGRAGDIFDPRAPRGAAMASLARRPWFSRLWVVQEVVLASQLRIQCGKHHIMGDVFFRAVDNACSIVTSPPQPSMLKPFLQAYKISQLRQRINRTGAPSYPYLAHSLAGWRCKDERDRLNALFGMVFRGNDAAGAWFSPCYLRTAEESYEDFAQAFIQQHNDLSILHFSGIGVHTKGILSLQEDGKYTVKLELPKYILPQWVPDWRIQPRPLPLSPESCYLRPATAFRASLAAPRYSLRPELLQLQVRAIQMDKVIACGPPWEPEDISISLPGNEPTDLPVLEEWYALAQEHAHATNLDSGFASTLVMGGEVATTEFKALGLPETESFCTTFQHWRALQNCTYEAAMRSVAERQPTELDGKVAQYAYHVREVCRTRRFFVTQEGRMGLGSITVEPGADVFIIHGLKTPFVADRVGERLHILRGDCYVHGLMYCGMRESEKDEDLYLV